MAAGSLAVVEGTAHPVVVERTGRVGHAAGVVDRMRRRAVCLEVGSAHARQYALGQRPESEH